MTKPYSEHTAQVIDEEVRDLVAKAYDRTIKLVEEHKSHIDAVSVGERLSSFVSDVGYPPYLFLLFQLAQRLLEKEQLQKEDLIEILGTRPFQEKSTYEELVGSGKLKAENKHAGSRLIYTELFCSRASG